jgi:hypothetical protein
MAVGKVSQARTVTSKSLFFNESVISDKDFRGGDKFLGRILIRGLFNIQVLLKLSSFLLWGITENMASVVCITAAKKGNKRDCGIESGGVAEGDEADNDETKDGTPVVRMFCTR